MPVLAAGMAFLTTSLQFCPSFLPGVRWRLVYLHEHVPGLWEAVCGKALSENRPAGLPAPQKNT